jgi:hypothetical protein
MDIRGMEWDAPQQVFAQSGEIPFGIAIRRDALVHLENENVFPGHCFPGKSAEHSPWSLTTAHSKGETSARGDGRLRFSEDESGGGFAN